MRTESRDSLRTWALLSPWIITLAVFWIYPLGYALFLSFTKYATLTNEMTWIGFENYERLFSDTVFWNALKNTAIFTFGTVPVTTAFAMVLAVAVRNRSPRIASFFRASFFLPSVTSLVVIALIFMNLYSRDGYVSALCSMMGVSVPRDGWLHDSSTALPAIMAMDVWISVGYYMVLLLAGMEAIPKDLYESAELSGASRRQQFFRITLPMLRSTLLFIVVINTIKSFQIFVEVYVMTKGGPLGATSTLVYEVYRQAFERSDSMGYASALAYVVFVILIVMSFLQMRLLRSRS
ncbi:MAG TPA: sugar ABC transporter permease [Chlorobiota bacterium]|nr:sugar ABC transporter permease [Chlorobiota bacterium]